MANNVRFTIPARREFVGLVRLAIGGLALAMPFDAETIEDIKLVMSEICTNIVLAADGPAPSSNLSFTVMLDPSEVVIDIDSGAAVEEVMSAASAAWERPKQSGYGLSIITALMDKVELVPASGHSILRLRKFT